MTTQERKNIYRNLAKDFLKIIAGIVMIIVAIYLMVCYYHKELPFGIPELSLGFDAAVLFLSIGFGIISLLGGLETLFIGLFGKDADILDKILKK